MNKCEKSMQLRAVNALDCTAFWLLLATYGMVWEGMCVKMRYVWWNAYLLNIGWTRFTAIILFGSGKVYAILWRWLLFNFSHFCCSFYVYLWLLYISLYICIILMSVSVYVFQRLSAAQKFRLLLNLFPLFPSLNG